MPRDITEMVHTAFGNEVRRHLPPRSGNAIHGHSDVGRQVFNPSLRARQQLLAQEPLFTQSVAHIVAPLVPLEHADANPLAGSGQHVSSVAHACPTAVVHEPAAAHQRATVHARVPSASVAQQPVEQSALVLHRGLQTCPAPGSEAHAVGAPFTAQH
jgi:hypothetical protein